MGRRKIRINTSKKAIDNLQDAELKRLRKDVKNLKGNNELKHKTTALTFQSVTVTNSQQNIANLVAQGNTDVTRVGDALQCEWVKYRFSLEGLDDSPVKIRTVLIWDKQNSITDMDDLLEASGTANENINSPLDWDKRRQFILLHDKVHVLQAGNVVGDGSTGNFANVKRFDIFKRLKGKETRFESTTTTILNNALKIFIMSDSASAVDMQGFVQMAFRG